ncbi:MAG: hypothetical protein LBF63_02720 [Treponema sp.]|jgi:type I restriction enzyme S subunit|nr:hypothetical protein [Treponema sp.]
MICVSEHERAIILKILKEYAPDCEARAFGSRYKWTSGDSSDLDLALTGKTKLGLSRLGRIRDAFEESELPFRVDALDWHCLSKEFQTIINSGYEVIYTPDKEKKEQWRKVRLSVILPPLPTQQAIAATLSCLNDKIVLNSRISANLEAQMQGIYEQSFCADKQKGCLSDICRYSRDRIAVTALTPTTYISTGNMLPDKAGYTDAVSLPQVAQTTKFDYGDILVSNIRPYFKKIVYCNFVGGCSTDVLCFSATKPELSAFLYCTLYNDQFFDHVLAGSKGTKMPRGDKRQIMNYPVIIPNKESLLRFSNVVKPMLILKHKISVQSRTLAAIRDTLLPKLMSGEIEVDL